MHEKCEMTGRAIQKLSRTAIQGKKGWVEKVVCMDTFNILPYINTALTGANPTAPQSRRRKSPAAWDSRKMTFYSEYLRDRRGIKSLRFEDTQ